MEDQWLCVSTTCGNHSQVHGRDKTRMQHQRLSAAVLNHSSGHGKAQTPMENQWLCRAGVVHKKVNGRGKAHPKWFIEQGLNRLSIESELPSEEDLMLEDAEAREEDLKF